MSLPQNISKIFEKKPYLVWYVKDKNNLSLESAFEHVLNYGDWNDFLTVKDTLGIKKAKKVFETIKSKKRMNLRLPTLNYFTSYFDKYA